MWTPTAARGSYERAQSENASDAVTLADEELALSAEELAMHDPLDEKNHALMAARGPARWTAFARRWWRRPSRDSDKGNRLSTDLRPSGQSMTISWLIVLLPSWSHRWLGHPRPDEPRRSTDYLDGLRGVASLFVFFNHYLMGGMDDIAKFSFGEGHHFNFIQLPFIRTIYSGGAMVAIFFVISGYVLSMRCIVAMRADNQDKVYTVLTSMTFRRAVRLFLPSLAASILSLAAVILGIQKSPVQGNWNLGGELRHFEQYLTDYLFRIWTWSDPLLLLGTSDWHGWYGGQLWTIPREFACSITLFMLLLAMARCRIGVRFAVEAALIPYLFSAGRWDVATFAAGMVLAEINLIAAKRPPPLSLRLALWAGLVAGWYLTGFVLVDQEHTPGYSFLSGWWAAEAPVKWRFWLAISGILVVGCLSLLPTAQRAFTTPIARYLGHISYALYLVHGVMNMTLRPVLWSVLGVLEHPGHHDNPFTWAWLAATIIYIWCVLWAADVFWRAIDARTVKFARWVEGKCFVSQESSG